MPKLSPRKNQVFTRTVFPCVSVNLREVTYESFQVFFSSSKYLAYAKNVQIAPDFMSATSLLIFFFACCSHGNHPKW